MNPNKLQNMKIIKIFIQFVNNVVQFTAYLANVFIKLFVNNIACFTAYLANAVYNSLYLFENF